MRIVVVDDSAFNRACVADVLRQSGHVEVIAELDDPQQALREVMRLKPDVLVMDVDMPRMGALLFLRTLFLQTSVAVLVTGCADNKQLFLHLLQYGAYDFVSRAQRHYHRADSALAVDLVAKVLAARSIVPGCLQKRLGAFYVPQAPSIVQVPQTKALAPKDRLERLVAIGASTGGPPALQAIFKQLNQLKQLEQHSRAAIVIAQHMPKHFTKAFAERLNRGCYMEVFEAEDEMPVCSGCAFVAPGGTHLEVHPKGRGLVCKIVPHDAAHQWVPSVDRLFVSSAKAVSERLLAVVLTGMGTDGSQGVRAVYAQGGRVLAESEQTAVVWGMPKEAIDTGCVHEVLPLDDIVKGIDAFARKTLPT